MGLAKRRLYKRERVAARISCAPALVAPLELPDATESEVSKALFCFCEQAGIIIGDAVDYDPLRDEYTCVAKVFDTLPGLTAAKLGAPGSGKVKDVKVAGHLVAMLVSFFRQKLAHQKLVQRRSLETQVHAIRRGLG